MPRSETVIQIFVASPDDVAEERAVLEELIRELNTAWARQLGVRLELVRWETDVVPGFGIDPQEVVNRNLPSDYDVFIGIMWARAGTPTGRAGSGTIEEFERAYARFRENPESVQILFYFKDQPVSPSAIDPAQLASVIEFKGRLGPLGGFYWTFRTVPEFQSFLRLHLTRLVQKWAPSSVAVSLAPLEQPVTLPNRLEGEAQEEGLIDLLETSNDALSKTREVTDRMTGTMLKLAASIRTRTMDLDALREKGTSADLKAIKRILGGAAEDLEEFVEHTNIDMPVFAEQLKTGVKAYGKAALIVKDFGENGLQQLSRVMKMLEELRTNMGRAREHLEGFRRTVASSPRMTTAYNHAKRKALDTIDALLREYDVADQLIREVEKSVVELLP